MNCCRYTQRNTEKKIINSPKKKGFVRLDSFEDYEIIDLDMVKEQQNIRPKEEHLLAHHQDNTGQSNLFDSRQYHPAAYMPPHYSELDRNIGSCSIPTSNIDNERLFGYVK